MSDAAIRVEGFLRRLAGVVDARIQTDAAGAITSVVVHAAPDVDPARVRDQVVSVCAAAGMPVDAARVQVAAAVDAAVAGMAVLEELEAEGRVRLVAYQVRVEETQAIAEIELALDARTARGTATARGAAPALDLLAQACLDALERLCNARVTLRLAGMQRLTLATGEVVCVAVHEIEGRDVRLHVGAVAAGDDLSRAAAYAALAAMNRRIGRILTGPARHYEIS